MSSPIAEIEPLTLSDRLHDLLRTRWKESYAYKKKEDNALDPVCVADRYPLLLESQDLAWASRFLPGSIRAWSNLLLKRAQIRAQQVARRFDVLRAHDQLFYGDPPGFAREYTDDAAFAYRRVAGPNAIEITRVEDLADLLTKIPLSRTAVARGLRRPIDLQRAVREGRLFLVDFCRIVQALRPQALSPRAMRKKGKVLRRRADRARTRDSRWRQKYLPAPIGVFLEDPDRAPHWLPLAIRIDQPQPDKREHNPVYHIGGGAGWKLAKLYFEVADQNAHFGCGHVHRTHFVIEPFCMATARQLSFQHPVHLLLQPHIRYTLATNNSAYKYFLDRRKIYFAFYAGTLEESRQLFIKSRVAFGKLDIHTELRSRGVMDRPHDYPYRDDALLWREAILRFVRAYVDAFYRRDAQVGADPELQAWAEELMSRDGGNVEGLVRSQRLDTVDKLVTLLAQVLFIAGPGHAAQHYSEMYYYRYAPAFPAAAYGPPPWQQERPTEARFRNTVPPIEPASLQFTYSQFGDFRFDRFGDYSAYPLARVRGAAAPIRQLQDDLQVIEHTIERRLSGRLIPYDFLLPSRVPNSINI
jgi:arachidonate 15-lipoxygenase